MMQCSTILMIMWFFVKTGYYMFYALSYKTEHTYNKWIKISNMLVIFLNAIFICFALFSKQDER
jgi:fumarate reductase subunit C